MATKVTDPLSSGLVNTYRSVPSARGVLGDQGGLAVAGGGRHRGGGGGGQGHRGQGQGQGRCQAGDSCRGGFGRRRRIASPQGFTFGGASSPGAYSPTPAAGRLLRRAWPAPPPVASVSDRPAEARGGSSTASAPARRAPGPRRRTSPGAGPAPPARRPEVAGGLEPARSAISATGRVVVLQEVYPRPQALRPQVAPGGRPQPPAEEAH